MLPDPGCYEERYRRGRILLGLAFVLLGLGWGLLIHTPLFAAILPALLAIPTVLTLALRPVAFRADHAGITLGSDRLLPRRPALLIPWTDVERIILYPGRKAAGLGDSDRRIEGPGQRQDRDDGCNGCGSLRSPSVRIPAAGRNRAGERVVARAV